MTIDEFIDLLAERKALRKRMLEVLELKEKE